MTITKDIQGKNSFWNKSDCFLNTIDNIDMQEIINDPNCQDHNSLSSFDD
ncbi:MAG: hypothetical protein AB3N34_01100 [Lettuce witches'-broom phytoplasma]